MAEYQFTLKFQLPEAEPDAEQHLQRLAEGGCEDALVGVGKTGRIGLSFIRESDSAAEAVLGAVSEVRRAIPGALLAECAPDFVGLTDAAALLGFSRQNMRQLLLSCAASTPVPVHEGKPSIWHLAELLKWLRDQKRYGISEDLLELAEVNMQINIAVNAKSAEPALQREIKSVLS